MEDRHQRLQEQCYALREGRVAVPQASNDAASKGANPMGRHRPLSGSDPCYTDDLVALYRQVRKKAAQRLGLLTSLLHRRRGLSIRNGVLLYMQLIQPICVPHLEVRCLQPPEVIQSKCLRIATGAPGYISNVPIHEDLGVAFFAEHIRALTESYDSKFAGVGNPLVQQLGRYLR